ncbi:MAG: FGGY-family carbohydrate kinase [Chthoniobacteraceae bacterium]
MRVRWGLKRSVIVSAGGGDNMMGAIGTGNLEAGIVTASFGTSGTLYSYATKPVVDPVGEVAAFCDSTGAWLPLVCTMNVTVATEQVRKLFGWSFEQVEQEIAGVSAGADGLLFLPYLTGERTPNLPEATGVLHGLTTKNYVAANIARATMEGATLGLAYGLKRFRELGIVPREIRLTGGGSKSAVWRQIAADIFGTSTVCLHSAEGAALGAAVQAAWCYAVVNNEGYSLTDLSQRLVKVDESTRAEPDTEKTKFYAGLLSKHTDLTRKLERGGFL